MRATRIEIEALIVGYAMSRLDRLYLVARQVQSWGQAFEQASEALGLPPATFKNLRDEFDPFFGNERKEWWKRSVRIDRQRVLVEFETVSDRALTELVDRVLSIDRDATESVVEAIGEPATRVSNVADRLLTGRMAESYFIERYETILETPGAVLEDHRLSLQGYDFSLREWPELVVEVKGLRKSSGSVLFTDREWSVASAKRGDYWLVVVGDLESTPQHRVVKDPIDKLDARCRYQTSIAASWHAPYRLD